MNTTKNQPDSGPSASSTDETSVRFAILTPRGLIQNSNQVPEQFTTDDRHEPELFETNMEGAAQ